MSRSKNRNRPRRPDDSPNSAAPEQVVQHRGIVLDRPGAEVELEREPLFTVRGKTYTIPVDPPASWTAMALMIAVDKGAPAALAWVMRRMLGDDGVEALRAYENLRQEDLKLITDTVQARVLPKVDGVPKGLPSSKTGPTPST